jgi:hypothetical protein
MDYGRVLKWPVVAWIIITLSAYLLSYITDIVGMMTPETMLPMVLAFGVWVGYKAVELDDEYGRIGKAFMAGASIGAVGAVLTVVTFGVFRGLGIDIFIPIAAMILLKSIAGAVIGGGFALTR